MLSKILKYIFPSSLFIVYLISAFLTDADSIIGIFFIGNISQGNNGLSISSQFQFIDNILSTIQEGIGSPLFYYVGQDYEAKRNRAIKKFRIILIVYLAFGLILSSGVYFFSEIFTYWINTPESIVELTKHNLQIGSISAPFVLLNFGLLDYIYTTETKFIMLIQGVRILAKFSVNLYLFGSRKLYGLNWGTSEIGASLDVISCIDFVLLLTSCCLIENMNPIQFMIYPVPVKDYESKNDHSTTNFKQFFNLCWGSMLDSVIKHSLYIALILNVWNQLGSSKIAAWKIFMSVLWGFLIIPANTMSTYLKVKIGHITEKSSANDGLSKYIQLIEIIKETLPCLIFWTTLMSIISIFTISYISKIISPYNEQVQLDFIKLFYDLGWTYILFSFVLSFESTLLGLGQTKILFNKTLTLSLLTEVPAFICLVTGVWTPTYNWIIYIIIANIFIDLVISFGCVVIVFIKIRKNTDENSIP